MQLRTTPTAVVAGLLLCFSFIAFLAHSAETAEKEEHKVFRDNEFNGWTIPFIQASPSDFSLDDDLFHFKISRTRGNLRAASVELKPKKTEYFNNPRKDSGVVAWPITKITTYQDLNGDGEFDWFLKNLPSKERPNGPNDIKEFIIVDDSIIEVRPQRTKPGFRKEFVSIKGERFVFSADGWVKQ